MRILGFIVLLMSSTLWAQDNFETRLTELQEKREDALFHWRAMNRFNETELTPHSKARAYQEFITKLENDHLAAVVSLHADACKTNPSHCLSESEKTKRESDLKTKLDGIANRVAPLVSSASQTPAAVVTPTVERRPSEVRSQRPSVENQGPRPDTRPVEQRPPRQQVVTPSSQTVRTPPVTTPEVSVAVSESKPETTPPVVTPEVKEEEPKPEVVTTPETKPEVVETPPEVKPEVRPEVKPETTPALPRENEDEKSPRNYNANTCKWVADMPRRIVVGPGCGGKSKSRICTGYVVCEQKVGGGKFVRQSTCGADKCGEGDAVSCTKDQYYFSSKPADETKQFVSPKLKQIMSSEQ